MNLGKPHCLNKTDSSYQKYRFRLEQRLTCGGVEAELLTSGETNIPKTVFVSLFNDIVLTNHFERTRPYFLAERLFPQLQKLCCERQVGVLNKLYSGTFDGKTTQFQRISQSALYLNSCVTHNTYKRTAIIKFWKHIYLPIKCNVRI